MSLLRHAALRASARPTIATPRIAVHKAVIPQAARCFSASAKLRDAHGEETFEEFTERFEKEFNAVNDSFDLQRNLNNAFAYDLVPSPSVIVAALRAARRVNDFPTAVRTFEAIKVKTESLHQYEEYLRELDPIREELGITLKDDLYPDLK